MIQVIIERWTGVDGATDHLWTLWQDGNRLHLGNKHGTADEAENEAIAFCHSEIGVQPDRIIRL